MFVLRPAGPREALISLADVDLGESFDTGTICTTQLYGYFFLESNCTGADKNHFSVRHQLNRICPITLQRCTVLSSSCVRCASECITWNGVWPGR